MGNYFSFNGTKVDISTPEMVLYGCTLGFGQLLMRNDKLGGSLDKEGMLVVGFLPFLNLIPLFMAKNGYFKKTDFTEAPLDFLGYIPVIFKFFFAFVLSMMGVELSSFMDALFMFGIIVIVNGLHFFNSYKCQDKPKEEIDYFNIIKKIFTYSAIEFGMPAIINFIIGFIPVVGTIISVMQMIPVIGPFISNILWSLSFLFIYLLLNMLDINYGKTTICTSSPSILLYIVAIISLLGNYML